MTPIHHNNCTYCQFRYKIFTTAKGRKKPVETERCRLTNKTLSPPMTDGRYCTLYRQIDCPCQLCQTTALETERNS
jgi:hypothetical protein